MDVQLPKLLCVDDEVDNLDALERIFRKKFQIFKAISATDAQTILNEHPDLAIIISDQRMPEISGVEFLESSVQSHPESIRILLTGYTDIESVISAINRGQIFRYITKPWDVTDLANTIDRAFEKYQLRLELREKNRELQKALHELQVLDKTKSQFMILINHELKTPLTAILSFSALLKETLLSEEQRLFVDRINRSSEKLRSIIEDVLTIVRGDLGLLKPKTESVRSDSLFQNFSPEITASIASKEQSLDVESFVEFVTCDSALMKTVLNRALHNATKFGYAKSRIRIKAIETSNHKTQIEVINDGPNIQPEMIEKVFKPFTLDENVMNHSVGMGLGLSICNTLVKAMGGELAILNEPNGVRFRIII